MGLRSGTPSCGFKATGLALRRGGAAQGCAADEGFVQVLEMPHLAQAAPKWSLNVQVHEARQYTDTANFTLRCKDCQIGVKGEKEAVAHAKATGHANFGEY